MKFLCPSCKAKYQIADEKVAGRTLRMSCRQCKEQIVIRGDAASVGAGVTGGGAPMSQPPGSISPTALGADFQRQMTGGASAYPDPNTADEWHVAINDIPVGPMGKQEVARKIAMGAVGPDSLAWREGLDDWLPIRHIAELAGLCQPAHTPPVGGSAVPVAPPPPAPVAIPPPPSQFDPTRGGGFDSAPLSGTGFDPAARSAAAPIGGRMGASAGDTAGPAPSASSDVAAPAARSYSPSELDVLGRGSKNNLTSAQMFLLVCGGAFILAMGALLGARLVPQEQQAAAPPATAPSEAASAEGPAGEVTAEGEQEGVAGSAIELDLQEIDGDTEEVQAAKRQSSKSSKSTAPAPSSEKGGKRLTAAERAKLERMGASFDSSAANLKPTSRKSGSGSSGKGQLTAAQLSKVVAKGKRSLQRCYETALRGAGSDEAVRMDIELTVSSSGNVSRVATRGKGLPGMDKCITRTVRMWRFPASSRSIDTRFPIVFQPGA